MTFYHFPNILMLEDCIFVAKYVFNVYIFIQDFFIFIPRLLYKFTIHRNVEEINSLWKKLSYFQHENYASRMGTAYRMLSEHSSSDEVFNINFQSAEGWYSQVVFKQQLKIKIVGMVFDDFFREAVVWMNGSLARCPVSKNLTYCIRNIQETIAENTGIWDLPNPKVFFLLELKSCLLN